VIGNFQSIFNVILTDTS